MIEAMRGYRSAADLAAVGRILRRTWAHAPGWNAWTFARFDIWSHWRLADERLLGETDWQDRIAMWEAGGDIVAAAFVGESQDDGVIVSDPGRAGLVPDLLEFLEECVPNGGLGVEVRASNRPLGELVRARGYELDERGHYVVRQKVLDPACLVGVTLSPGLRVVELEDDALDRYNVAVRDVFGHVGGTPEAYAMVRRGPSAVRELELVVVDGDDRVVGFAEAWLDRSSRIAEFEPVGTIPARRREGIAAAVMSEVENRLRRLGCRLATVHSWSASQPANGLYDALGYEAVDRQVTWRAPRRP